MIEMANIGVSEFILVIAAVIIGLVIFGFTEGYLVPQYVFTNAQQQANAISQSVFITVSPPAINSSSAAYVAYIYSPLYKGNYTIIAFYVSSSQLPTVGLANPPASSIPVYLISGSKLVKASSVNVPKIYDTNGHILAVNVQGYSVPANQPFEIVAPKPKSGQSLVVWVVYQTSGYYFRLTYTFQG